MKKNKNSIVSSVSGHLVPVIESLGYMLWDIEYVKEGADMVLRIIIDHENGISISDCEKVTSAVNPILDETDLIECAYRLEVSSPGIERALKRPEHFLSSVGKLVELSLYTPLNQSKTISGILKEYSKDRTVIECNNEEISIDASNIAKAHTVFDWNSK